MHGPANIGPPVVFWTKFIDKKGTLKLLPSSGNKLQIYEGSYFIPSKL